MNGRRGAQASRYPLKSARVEQNVTEDEVVETHVDEVAVGVDDVLYGMIELDARVGDIGQCRCPLFEIVAFEQLHILGKPQRQPIEPSPFKSKLHSSHYVHHINQLIRKLDDN